MELRRLRYFVAVADHLSFRRAGEALRTAQPSLSQQIRALEAELGVELFERTKRQVRLTNAGAELLSGVRPVIDQLDAWAQRAREAQTGSHGRLNIGTNGMVLIEHLPRVVRTFRSMHPQVQVQLGALRSPELRQAIRNGHVEIAFTTDDSPDDRLDACLLWTLAQRVVLPSDHPLATKPSIALRDLQDDMLITHPDRGVGGNDTVMALCHEQQYVPKRIRHVPDQADLDSLIGLVACGFGFTILPAPYQHLAPSSVVFKPLAGAAQPLQIFARWRSNDTNPLIENFIATARADARTFSETNGRLN